MSIECVIFMRIVDSFFHSLRCCNHSWTRKNEDEESRLNHIHVHCRKPFLFCLGCTPWSRSLDVVDDQPSVFRAHHVVALNKQLDVDFRLSCLLSCCCLLGVIGIRVIIHAGLLLALAKPTC